MISLIDHFSLLEDPGITKKSAHKLLSIIMISICATLCGANTWVEMEGVGIFGVAKDILLTESLSDFMIKAEAKLIECPDADNTLFHL